MLKIVVAAIVIIIFGLIFFDVGFITSRFIKPNTPFSNSAEQKQAPVSGVVKLNGPIPRESSISVGVRDHGSSDVYKIFVSLPAADETAWKYIGALTGSSYEFQAYLDSSGQRLTTSESLTVTAPATDEILTLDIEVPMEDPALVPATISGTVYINGYIPQGATFDVLGRVYGSTGNFSEVVDNLPALVKRTITYSKAQSGTKYEIKGQLFDKNGTVVGSSKSVVLSAPSDNAEMTINSTAQPPAGAVTLIQNNTVAPAAGQTTESPLPAGNSAISGTINFNGSAPGGSSIVILAAPQGQTNYQTVVNGISPTNGTTWTWNGAATGTTYNMVAVLKGQTNGQNIDYADSQTYTVAAPASNQLFTINTGISMGAPTGSVSITCGTKNNNVWNGTLNFSSVTGAQYYSMQLGSATGGNDIANVNQAAQSTTNQTINVSGIKDSVVYYAQYAVSSVTNPTPAQYSPYSGAYTIKCP
ncbi:MAG TPA: hypothetical protein VJG66_02800 [Patescibacteria group bacterium]|nr:hypothetical protein [Patescibacteria group bacterium]